MGCKSLSVLLCLLAVAAAQSNYYKVCLTAATTNECQSLDKDGSRVVCEPVSSKIDCALKLARGEADFGYFSEEELLLLAKQQPADHRVIASIKDNSREGSFAFEAVAVVSSQHTGGLDGLKGGKYCHPGLDATEVRWSPRVLKTLESVVVRTDRCPDEDTNGKSAEEIEVLQLSKYFSAACRPGRWHSDATIDARLKSENPSLCSLCGAENATCDAYTIDMGLSLTGINNNNRHVQALQCLTSNNNGAVAFVAWQHVKEYFTIKAPSMATSFSILCEDGTITPLTNEILAREQSPCSFVKQPWGAIVATASKASSILSELQTWWPNGQNPGGDTWQAQLFSSLVKGTTVKAVFQDGLPAPSNYTADRKLTDIDFTSACMPTRRWCTVSVQENVKCTWVRRAAYILGLQPSISCQQRENVFRCLEDIRDDRADFISLDSNYGYIARQHYKLSPVKLLQNSRSSQKSMSRVVALIKNTSNISRFENLRGRRACFPEFGGIAYVAFLRTAHERSIISASDCDYAQAVGDFFEGACAPGAVDAAHAIAETSYDATKLCSGCKLVTRNTTADSEYTCAWDYNNNLYFGNNGSVACLADPLNDIAFVEAQNLDTHLLQLKLQGSQFRALCRNNTLALSAGVTVDDACLLALVVDGEILSRRNDQQFNSLSSLLTLLDQFFGYNAATATQLINLEIFSPFDGVNDLLFKDTAVGLTEPSATTAHEPAKNYFELFKHLETCTGSAPGLAMKSSVTSIISMVLIAFLAKIIA